MADPIGTTGVGTPQGDPAPETGDHLCEKLVGIEVLSVFVGHAAPTSIPNQVTKAFLFTIFSRNGLIMKAIYSGLPTPRIDQGQV